LNWRGSDGGDESGKVAGVSERRRKRGLGKSERG
jgi:hypothetical protein